MPGKFRSNPGKFMKAVRNQVQTNVENTTQTYSDDLKEKLDTPPPRSGWEYRNIKGKDVHIASAPGEPPAPLSRDLINSISTTFISKGANVRSGITWSDLNYARFLEQGTSFIEERPAWVKVIRENREKYAIMMTKGFKRR